MLENVAIEDVLFLDIETVPATASLDEISEDMQELWNKKSSNFRSADESAADVYQRAGIYAEFGRIVCISVGLIRRHDGDMTFRSKSFADKDERKLLVDFANMIDAFCSRNLPQRNVCGHNIKEFDIPFIARRMLINGIVLPEVLNIAGKKPWEVKFIDTLELWKFGDYKNYTSLNLLTHIFGIPTPKDDIDGSQVADVYYKEDDLQRISIYCEKDVLATAQLLLRFKGQPIIAPKNVEHVD